VRDATIMLDGLRFHYCEWGDPGAPPLVLLHAYTMHARTWDTFAQAMAGRFRVLALDQRGHGETDWVPLAGYAEELRHHDLRAFVEALQLGRCSLVGFSFGGTTACSYAALYPESAERLVMFECFSAGRGPAAQAHLTALRSLPETFAAPEEAASAFQPLAPYAPEDELRHWMRGSLMQREDDIWIWRTDPLLRMPPGPGWPPRVPKPEVLRERLAQVRCPTLLVVGEKSFEVEAAELAAAANPRARFVRIPQAGHWVPLDNPEGFLGGRRPISHRRVTPVNRRRVKPRGCPW
jgi:esterase